MLSRRDVLLTAGAAALISTPSRAADYPTRPVHIVNPTAPGGSSDVLARLFGEVLGDRLGQTFIVDDRPGAGSNIAADIVHRAPADGYTLFAISKGAVLSNLLYDHLDFDFARDFVPVAPFGVAPLVMLVHPSVPAKTLAEFIAYCKANPGKINYGSAGNGSDPHLAGELFKQLAGVEMTHVPYRGGALAFTDLLAGSVQLMFSNLPSADYQKDGRLRGLAVSTLKRSPAYPDLPAVAEFVPGYDNGVWFGLAAPTGTPPEVIARLNATMSASLKDPKLLQGLKVLNAEPMPMTSAEFGEVFKQELVRWGKVIAAAHIKPE